MTKNPNVDSSTSYALDTELNTLLPTPDESFPITDILLD